MKIFYLLFATIILTSCKNITEVTDCSAIFEDWKPQKFSNLSTSKPVKACKVLPIKLGQNMKCEIAGSDSLDNLKDFYDQDKTERTILALPLKSLTDNQLMSYKNIMLLYNIKNKIDDHVDSDLFNNFKDFRYHGIKCEMPNRKLIAWIGEGKLLASLEDSLEITSENNEEINNTPKPKVTPNQRAKARTRVNKEEK